jgi:transposase
MIVRPYVPEPVYVPNLEEPKYSRRDVVDGIFYRERTGCQWRNLPHDLPPWKQVFEYFRKWRNDGTIEALHDALRLSPSAACTRRDGGTERSSPAWLVVDFTAEGEPFGVAINAPAPSSIPGRFIDLLLGHRADGQSDPRDRR